MDEPTFDIFRCEDKADAVWVEAVYGLSAARVRMEQIAAAHPGHYFLFDALSNLILAQIDTLPRAEQKTKSA
jgi:hypothetical protein